MRKPQFVAHDGIYLLNHSVGRPPAGSRQWLADGFFEPWESGDAEVWPLWLEQVESFRAGLGLLLNASAEDICPQVNLSGALSKIIYSLPRISGKNAIVMTEQDFPSMGFVLAQANRAGFEVRIIPASDDTSDPNVWREYLTDDVRFALVTLVYSNTGLQLPVADITKIAREREILSIVDVCQGVGVVPVNLESWRADFVLGSCVKWLCGGPGAGFLWVDPAIVEQCQPVDVGWFSHEDPFEFDIHNFRYADRALRFWGGTPSVLPFVLAAGSVKVITDMGVDRIRQHNLLLADIIMNAVPEERIVNPRAAASRGGTVVLDFGERRTDIEQRLRESRVRFDTRSTGIRLSPHIYNTAWEMEQVVGALMG